MTTSTIPATHALFDGPQVFEFTRWADTVCIARWLVTPCGKRRHARRLTGQWRFSVDGARKLWTELKRDGAQHFDGFDD